MKVRVDERPRDSAEPAWIWEATHMIFRVPVTCEFHGQAVESEDSGENARHIT